MVAVVASATAVVIPARLRRCIGIVAEGKQLLLEGVAHGVDSTLEGLLRLGVEDAEDLLVRIELVEIGHSCLALVRELHERDAAILFALLALDEALLLELAQKLGEGLLAHAEKEAELLLRRLRLCLEHCEHAALALQGIADAAVGLGVELDVAVHEASQAARFLDEGHVLRRGCGLCLLFGSLDLDVLLFVHSNLFHGFLLLLCTSRLLCG